MNEEEPKLPNFCANEIYKTDWEHPDNNNEICIVNQKTMNDDEEKHELQKKVD